MEPRALAKKCFRSGVVKRLLPSARFAAIDSDAAIQLVRQKCVALRERFSPGENLVGGADGFLVDDKLFEGEGHIGPHPVGMNLRAEGSKETAGEGSSAANSTRYPHGPRLKSPLSFLLFPALSRRSRDGSGSESNRPGAAFTTPQRL